MAALVALAFMAGCQLFVNTDALTNEKCDADKKLCNGRCVPKDPGHGCASSVICAPCNLPHAYAQCSPDGLCVSNGCIGTYRDCDPDQPGCETDVAHDPSNCGACGWVCATPPNGMPGCSARMCAIGGCIAGWEDCNSKVDDGCETQISVNPLHCGRCFHACDSGVCEDGTCVAAPADASADAL